MTRVLPLLSMKKEVTTRREGEGEGAYFRKCSKSVSSSKKKYSRVDETKRVCDHRVMILPTLSKTVLHFGATVLSHFASLSAAPFTPFKKVHVCLFLIISSEENRGVGDPAA